MGIFTAAVAAVSVTNHYRHILKVTLATLRADWAVVGVIEHQ